MKKIAFIGTHGTGKTILAYEFTALLKKQGYNADVVKEVARKCPFPLNENRCLEGQRWIVLEQVKEEIELARNNEVVVCDRSVLDNYAYLVSKFGHDDLVYGFVDGWIRTYNLLFRVPICKDYLKEDGVRSIDEKFQREIDDSVDRLIRDFEVEVYPYRSLNDCFEKFSGLE